MLVLKQQRSWELSPTRQSLHAHCFLSCSDAPTCLLWHWTEDPLQQGPQRGSSGLLPWGEVGREGVACSWAGSFLCSDRPQGHIQFCVQLQEIRAELFTLCISFLWLSQQIYTGGLKQQKYIFPQFWRPDA